jgi:hypothetical protein
VAQVLREVLHHGKKSVVVPAPFSGVVIDPTLTLYIKNGWLYNKQPSPSVASRDYVFASPLHRRFVEWMLLGNPKSEETLSCFGSHSPLNLLGPRQVGSSVQPVPEAQFQDELYRA